MLKSGAVMVRFSVAEWLVAPEVPVIVTVNVPAVADEEAFSVRVEEELPPAGGVTLVVENVAVTPLGRPETLRAVAALNPFRLPTVTVAEPLLPSMTFSEPGETPMLKSGATM